MSQTNSTFERIVRIHPRPSIHYLAQGRTVLATGIDGFITDNEPEEGLWVFDTRLLSRYRWLVDGKPVRNVVYSSVELHTALGYYLGEPRTLPAENPDGGSGMVENVAERSLELRLSRFVGDGVHEDLDIENFTGFRVKFRLELELDADFADAHETQQRKRRQKGRLTRQWQAFDARLYELRYDYRATHRYSHQGNTGTAHLHRGLTVRLHRAPSPARYRNRRIRFDVELEPRATWHACLELIPFIDGETLDPAYGCYAFFSDSTSLDKRRRIFLDESTSFSAPGVSGDLRGAVLPALEQAKRDLALLRLFDLDHSERAWVPAAGLPIYLALFGRDTLSVAWQSAIVSPDLMRGTLPELARWQGTEVNPWRDEQPGRMIHEAHSGPLAVLQFNPRNRYYGAITTSAFYGFVLSELWHWAADRETIAPLVEPALRAIQWADHYTRHDDGFYYYDTMSEQGVKNQSWKDSGDAIVRQDGSIVPNPIASCEAQSFIYATKLRMAEVLGWFGSKEDALRLYREAEELKKRFNERFWMEDEGFFAMGLGPHGEQIRSIGSDPGHCLATGIVDASLVERTADRLMMDDLFSGWGVRTLSSRHVSYDPFSYHRGTVWPVEQGAFSLGFYRYGLHHYVQMLTRAQFEASALFDLHRLPECFSGHARDREHPFPAIYPKANWPQAWSSSALFSMIQALLGLYAYAPLNLLLVDPHLPDWLPEITLKRIRVAGGSADLRFWRRADGHSEYEVLSTEGPVHVVRQPSPWSMTATLPERARDLFVSLLPGK